MPLASSLPQNSNEPSLLQSNAHTATHTVYTLQIQSALGAAGAGDTALFFGCLGAITAACLAAPLAALHAVGALDTSRVTRAALGLAAVNGGCRAVHALRRAPGAGASCMMQLYLLL